VTPVTASGVPVFGPRPKTYFKLLNINGLRNIHVGVNAPQTGA
jgi:hypothetical protein